MRKKVVFESLALAVAWMILASLSVSCTKSEVIEMVLIPDGDLMMDARLIGGAKTRVKISRFYMGVYEVTQKQYRAVMGENPSHFKGKDGNPVERVSWYNAVLFCNKLSVQAGYTPCYIIDRTIKDPESNKDFDDLGWSVSFIDGANGFRLPTSQEWEYACRAGTTSPYYWGGKVDGEFCWYSDNSNGTTQPVGRKKPNKFGISDISGNVSEWCYDRYPYYPGSNTRGQRVIRGGNVFEPGYHMESAYVDSRFPSNEYYHIGIRLARSL